MFSFNFKFDRQLNVSNQIHQKESWKSVDVVLGSIKRLKLTAQGMEQRTNVQSQVWYHSAVHIVNFNMSKELKIQISQTCLQMDGGCQCSVGDNISKSCLWVFVFKLKSLKCVFYLSLSLSLSLFQFESNKIFQQKKSTSREKHLLCWIENVVKNVIKTSSFLRRKRVAISFWR